MEMYKDINRIEDNPNKMTFHEVKYKDLTLKINHRMSSMEQTRFNQQLLFIALGVVVNLSLA